jgi:hypothetical protein
MFFDKQLRYALISAYHISVNVQVIYFHDKR